MPNDSRSRRDKREKEKKRKDKKNSKPLHRKPSTVDSDTSSSDKDDTHAEEALAISVSQTGGMAATRKGNSGSEALDSFLSFFASLSSSAEAKESSNGEKTLLQRRLRWQPLRWQRRGDPQSFLGPSRQVNM
jgi:hypothetical protein